jgi:hypothetical protein
VKSVRLVASKPPFAPTSTSPRSSTGEACRAAEQSSQLQPLSLYSLRVAAVEWSSARAREQQQKWQQCSTQSDRHT